MDPPVDAAAFELVGTREAPLMVTTFTEVEVIREEERVRQQGLGLLMGGAAILILSFFV